MSVNIVEIIKLYDTDPLAQVLFDRWAGNQDVGSPPNESVNVCIDTLRKSGVAFCRKAVVHVFRRLEVHGAGRIVDNPRAGTEFTWNVSPVLMSRMATGERLSL